MKDKNITGTCTSRPMVITFKNPYKQKTIWKKCIDTFFPYELHIKLTKSIKL